ncbi:hypothetical protein [Brochothrix thermosphacta]|uniref:hypothetical protein n=2 Tax=Brochothrix thermosphacta TaxID=2756 RepID=UPI0039B02A58
MKTLMKRFTSIVCIISIGASVIPVNAAEVDRGISASKILADSKDPIIEAEPQAELPKVQKPEKVVPKANIEKTRPQTRTNYSYYLEARELEDSLIPGIRNNIIDAIKTSSKKLGYLKGSTLEVKIPYMETVPEFYYPPNNTTIRFSGRIEISDISFNTDDTVSIAYKPGTLDTLVFTKLKNEPSNTSLNLTYSKAHILHTYSRLVFWTKVEDEIEKRAAGSIGAYQLGFAEAAPELEVEAKKEVTRLVSNSEHTFKAEDYYTVKKSAGKVTAKFLTQPDTSKIGTMKATIELTDEYKQTTTIEVPFEVYEELSADPVAQDLVLGSKITTDMLHGWVKNVTSLSTGEISPTDYEVKLTDEFTTTAIGDFNVKVSVSSKVSNDKVEVSVPVTVSMGDAIELSNTQGEKIGALTVNDNQLSLVNVDQKVTGIIGNDIEIAVFDGNMQLPILNQTKPSKHAKLAATANKSEFIKLPIAGTITKDTVIKVANNGMKEDTELLINYYSGIKEWKMPYRFIEDQAIYYHYNGERFEAVEVAHLTKKTVAIKRMATHQDLDKVGNEFFLKPMDQTIKFISFSEYPDTSKVGKQPGKIIVEQTLPAGNKVRFEHNVEADIDTGTISFAADKTMIFDDITLTNKNMTVGRLSDDWQLKVNDTRVETLKSDWQLYAKVSGDKTLDPYMTYVDESNGKHSMLENVPIYQQKQSVEAANETIIKWEANQGIMLDIPKNSDLQADEKYQSTIEWTLVLGEE